MTQRNHRVVFLDRDGVLNSSYPEYVGKWDDYVLYPWAMQVLRLLRQAHAKVFLVTNQSGIGRGYFSEDQLNTILDNLQNRVQASGGNLTDVYYCPHVPEKNCSCRKPAPGMLKAAAKQYSIELERAWMIGDHGVDISAGKKVGAKTILVKTGRGKDMSPSEVAPDYIYENTLDAVNAIVNLWEQSE